MNGTKQVDSKGAPYRPAYQPLKVVLYGFCVRGDQQASNDIDVEVIVERVDRDFLDAETGLCRMQRDIDDRIEPVLLEIERTEVGFWTPSYEPGRLCTTEPSRNRLAGSPPHMPPAGRPPAPVHRFE